MKKLKIFKKSFTLILILQIGLSIVLIAAPQKTEAQTYTSLNFEPQVELPVAPFDTSSVKVGRYDKHTGAMISDLLAHYIKALYNYGLMIGGILATVILMAGGVLWLVSAGNDSKIMQAKELISGSIVGLVILFGSWLILDTINPNLTMMSSIRTKIINKSTLTLGCCVNAKTKRASNKTNGECKRPNTFHADQMANWKTKRCELSGCCVITKNSSPPSTVSCQKTLQSECRKTNIILIKTNGEQNFYNKSCQSLSQCPANKITTGECIGKPNGSLCDVSPPPHYCYNNICTHTLGQRGDSCGGDSSKSICVHGHFSCSKGLIHDKAGRNCDSGLICCYDPTW